MEKLILPHQHGDGTHLALANMPESARISEAAALFSQLADPSRLRIFLLLCHCEECVINIAAAVGMSTAAVSHHLKSLRLHGLIVSRRAGKEVYYTLAATEAAQTAHHVAEDFLQISCP